MRTHISISMLLSAVFAVGAVGVAHATERITATYVSTRGSWSSTDQTSISPASAALGPSRPYEQSQVFTANPPAGHKVTKWLWKDDLNFRDESSMSEIAGEQSTCTIGYSSDGSYALGVRFDYILFDVTFRGNGATSGSTASITGKNIDSTSFTLTANGFKKTGYTFSGWKDDLGKAFANSASVTGKKFWDATTCEFHSELTAQWTANTYAVKFNGNGATSGSMSNETFAYDSENALTANAYTKNGCVFAGWATNATEGAVVYADKANVKNLTSVNNGIVNLYARWTANTYTVTVDKNGGTGGSGTTYTISSSRQTKTITLPTRTGYSITGWTVSGATGTTPTVSGTTLTIPANVYGNLTLTPTWTVNKYTVTFHDPSGANADVVRSVSYEQSASAPNWSRSGYKSPTWDKAFSSVTANMTVNAQWTPETYTITYTGLMPGATNPNPTTYTIDTPTITFAPPTGVTGFTFSRWSLASIAKGSTGNKTVTASYLTWIEKPTPAQYELTYNGGLQTIASGSNMSASGNQATVPGAYTATFTPNSGYCWNDGAVTSYSFKWTIVNASIANATVTQSGTLTYNGKSQQPQVYARATVKGSQAVTWKYSKSPGDYVATMPSFIDAGTHTVYFEASAPYHNSARGSFQVVIGRAQTAAVGFSSTSLSYTGREQGPDVTFTHCTEATGSVKRGTNVGTYKVKATPDDNYAWSDGGTATREFEWRIVEGSFTATVSAGEGGSGGSSVGYCSSQELVERWITLPTRTGYQIAKWTASGYVGDAPTVSGNTLTIPARTAGDFTVTPTWTPIAYTIEFNANGGEGTMAAKTLAYDEEYIVPECDFAKTGCEFQSWQVIIDNRTVTNYPAGTVVSNLTSVAGKVVTFKADWLGRYTIAFDANDGEGEMASTNVERDVGCQLPSNAFTRTGYDFTMWTTNLPPNEKSLIADGATVTNLVAAGETCTLHALWDPHHYTVSFDANGGTGAVPEEKELAYDEQMTVPDSSSLTPPLHYEFTGWGTNPKQETGTYQPGESVSNLTAAADGQVTLYAIWKFIPSPISAALDCNNLYFEDGIGNTSWSVDDEHYCPEDASNSCMTHPNGVGTIFANVKSSGTLTFWWMGEYEAGDIWSGDEDRWTTLILECNGEPTEFNCPENLSSKWQKVKVRIESASTVAFSHKESLPCWVDHVTWVPDGGGDPTRGDPIAVTAAGVDGNVFSLTVPTVNGTDYGVWTNADLTVDSWGLMGEPWTGDGNPRKVEWPILPGFPQLFFRAHKVEYK